MSRSKKGRYGKLTSIISAFFYRKNAKDFSGKKESYEQERGVRRNERNRRNHGKILLQCAFLLSLDLSDTQRLLDIGQKPRLYPRVRYDAAIIYGLEEKMTLDQMNSFLDEIGEETLL